MLHTETWLISFCLNPIKYIRPIMEQQEVNYCNHIPSSLAAASLPDIQKPQLDLFWTIWNIQIIRYYYINTLKVLLWLLKLKIFPSNKKKDKIHMSVENPLLWIWSPVIVIWWLMCWSRIQHRAWWPDHQTLWTLWILWTLNLSTEQNFTVYTC